MDLISVIMPTYNAAKWVSCTIDNLAAQTYPHFELIVSDDGSQDDTVAVVRKKLAKSFKHPWQIIERGKNKGPSAARNLALKAAQGRWVQFLDSDDFIAPSKFALQAAHCARVAADVAAVYSPWSQCHIEDGRVTAAAEGCRCSRSISCWRAARSRSYRSRRSVRTHSSASAGRTEPAAMPVTRRNSPSVRRSRSADGT